MERNHDHIARCCRPSHARGDARNGQATFALVSYTKRSDDPGRNPGASLSSSVIGWRGLSARLALDYQRCCARHKPGRRAQRAAFLASACLGRAVCDCRRTLTPPSGRGLLTLTLLLIVFFIVEGISKVIFSLTVRPFPNWGWVLASGIVGILLALYLWANLPITAVWLGVLLGIQLRRGRSRLSGLEGAYELR